MSSLSAGTAQDLVTALLNEGDWSAEEFGAGRFSQTFRVTGPGGQHVLRVAPPDSVRQLFYEHRMMRQEPGIHARLLAETDVPIPPILAHDFSRDRIDRDYLLMPLLPGTPLSEAGLAPDAKARALREWGRHVAKIHTITDPAGRFGYLGEHECMTPRASWPEAFAEMFRRELVDIVACGIYDQATADMAFKLLDKHLPIFGHCDTSRLLHGDLLVTNLLVKPDGAVTGVIDFDRACWGDVEWDLAIAEYCDVTQPSFWDGYGHLVETHQGEAAIRRMFYLLYEHQKYIVISMSIRRDDLAGARRYARDSLAVMDNFRRTGKPAF